MKILIEELEFEAIIGILDFERVSPQRVIVDLKIDYEYKKDEFLDYAKIVELVKDLIQTKKYLLIEEAIEGVFELLESRFSPITFIECKISKPDILKGCRVSIQDSKRA